MLGQSFEFVQLCDRSGGYKETAVVRSTQLELVGGKGENGIQGQCSLSGNIYKAPFQSVQLF